MAAAKQYLSTFVVLSSDMWLVKFGVAFHMLRAHSPQNQARHSSLSSVRRDTSQSDQTGKYFLLTAWKRSGLRCVDATLCNETWGAARRGALASTSAFQGRGGIPHPNQPALLQI